MTARTRVRARVVIRRRVAAKRHSAILTGAEVHPTRRDLDALLTLSALGAFYCLDVVDVRTAVGQIATSVSCQP